MEVVGQQESPDKMEPTAAEYTVVDDMDGPIGDIDHNITEEERKLLEETEGDAGVGNGETEQDADAGTAGEQGNPEVTLALSLQEKGYKYKPEYVRDAVRNRRMKTFAMYPINMQDLALSSVKMCLEKCCDFNWNVSDITRTDSNALEGILDIQFSTMEDAEEAEQLLPGVKEGLKLHRLTGGSDKALDEAQRQSHRFDEIGAKLLDNYKEKERPAKRMLVITNLPESVTERNLLEIFPTGFVGIAMKESKERLGHAIVEFDTREEMLAELEHRNGVELGGVSLKLVDMMMTGVEQLEKRTVFTKAKELADVRVELARSWHIHYSHERKNFIKRIYGLETQLKLDESLKGQTDNETATWRVEVKRRLEKKQEDLPEDRTARLMMSVEDLCKEYEKHASMEPSTIRSSSYRGSGGGATRGSRSSWNRDGDFDDFRGGYSRHSSRGGYRDESFRRRTPYSRDFRDRGPSREGGVSGLKTELGSLIQGSLSEQNQAQALDLLAGLTEILGSKGGQKQGQQSTGLMQHDYSPSSSASYMRSDSDTSIQQRDFYGSYSSRMESPRGSRGRGGSGGARGGRGGASRRSEYRVIVSGLPQTGSWQDLKDHMRTCGDVCYSEVNKDSTGVVEYTRFDDMKIAVRKLDDSKFQSHQGEVSYIRVREDFHGGGGSGASRW